MFDSPDLELHGVAYVDDKPLLCGQCENGFSLHLRKRGPRETWPASVSCLACGSVEDSSVVTNGLVDAARAAVTGRKKAAGRNTFAAQWRGTTMRGQLKPDLIADDVRLIAGALHSTVTKQVVGQPNSFGTETGSSG